MTFENQNKKLSILSAIIISEKESFIESNNADRKMTNTIIKSTGSIVNYTCIDTISIISKLIEMRAQKITVIQYNLVIFIKQACIRYWI